MAAIGSVLLVDDHGLVRHGIQMLIAEAMPSLSVSVASTFKEALEILRTKGRFDLVLLDLTLGDVHGLAGLRQLRDDYPYVAVVIISAHDDRDTVLATIKSGAMGFISKAAEPVELGKALRDVLIHRKVHLPATVSRPPRHEAGAGRPLSSLSALGLTERQIEVLGLVVQGLRNKEIARELQISEIMVKKHITPVLQALGVADRTRLLVTLSQQGYQLPSIHAPGSPL